MQLTTRSDLRILKAELEAALKVVETKLGVKIDIGRLSGEVNNIRCKLTTTPAGVPQSPAIELDTWKPGPEVHSEIMAAASAAFPGVDMRELTGEGKPSADLEAAIKRYGLRLTNAKGDRLTGYHPNRPKYPFTYQSIRGARWKESIEQAQKRFGAN